MYRIAWRSKFTKATGYGTGLFTKEDAEKIADSLNKEKNAICEHWAELAPAQQAVAGDAKSEVVKQETGA